MKAIVRERGIPFPLREEGIIVEEVPVDDEIQASMNAAVSGWKSSKKKQGRHGRHPRRLRHRARLKKAFTWYPQWAAPNVECIVQTGR